MQSLLSITSMLGVSVSFTQLFSTLPVVGGECSECLGLLRCDLGFFSKTGPQDRMSCGGENHLQHTPAQQGIEI